LLPVEDEQKLAGLASVGMETAAPVVAELMVAECSPFVVSVYLPVVVLIVEELLVEFDLPSFMTNDKY
jgi:hypothetical protein